jgi:hypothetical protein
VLYDVIGVVAEFMVRVLQLQGPFVLYDVIGVVAKVMVRVRVRARAAVRVVQLVAFSVWTEFIV